MKTILGIDLGTQSLKSVFYDYENHAVVAIGSSPLTVNRDDTGKAEQAADNWIKALDDCMAQIDADIRQSVQAIAVSGQQHGFVALDAAGKVLAPVKLWCDTATQREVDELTEACGGMAQAIEMTGNPVMAGYTSPKILWLKKKHPELYQQMTHILLPHDYINFFLSGNLCMEAGDASGTGLLDVRTRRWSHEMLRILDKDRDLSQCLPPVVDPDCFIGTITPTIATRLGLPENTPVATGGGDNMMGAIGTGNVLPGKLTMSLGSSGTLYTSTDKPIIDPEGNIAAFCNSVGGWLPLLCTMNCTLSTEIMRQMLGVGLDDFEEAVGKVAPGSDGLTVLPFFNGERTPNLPNATASVTGLNSHNCTREHLLHATMEGTCFALKFGLDTMTHLDVQAHDIILTGGGSRSQTWRQMIADIFQMPVSLYHGDEGASFGAVLQALWVLHKATGNNIDLDSLCSEHLRRDETRCAMPDPENGKLYQAAYETYQDTLKQLTPLLARPPALQALSSSGKNHE